MNVFPADHPRVVAVSPALTPAMRAAMWPRGIHADVLAVSERKAGIKPPAPASKPAPKPAVTTVAAKPSTPTPQPSQARAPAAKAAPPATPSPTQRQQLDAAMERAIREFNEIGRAHV